MTDLDAWMRAYGRPPMTYERERLRVLSDPAMSGWLKVAVETLGERDPVDAFNDAEFLLALSWLRMSEQVK